MAPVPLHVWMTPRRLRSVVLETIGKLLAVRPVYAVPLVPQCVPPVVPVLHPVGQTLVLQQVQPVCSPSHGQDRLIHPAHPGCMEAPSREGTGALQKLTVRETM